METNTHITITSIPPALRRAKWPILTVGLTYLIAVLVGILMANAGATLAVGTRDRIVGQAVASDPSMQALESGNRLKAGLIDFSANLFLGAVPSTVTGLGVIFTFPIAV